MANVKVTELTALTAADSASTDVLPIVDVSADATKKLAISDLHRSVPDGTLSAPGIAFQSDLNSGLYRSGTDAIALVTNGAARILIDATGNVTIPNDLTVEGTTTFIDSQTLRIEDKNIELGVVTTPTDVTADGGGITLKGATDKTIQWINSTGAWTFNQPVDISGDVQAGSGAADARITIGSHGTAGTNDSVHVRADGANLLFMSGSGGLTRFEQNGSTRFTITSTGNAEFNGNVGVNTSSFPANGKNLKISDGTISRLVLEKTGTGARVFEVGVGNSFLNVYDATADEERIRIDNNGNVGIGTTSPNSPGSYAKTLEVSNADSASIVLSRTNSTAHSLELGVFNGNSLIESTGAASLRFKTNSSERMRIDSSGNVGIGRTSPAQNLDVASTSNIAYALDGWALAGKGDSSDILFGGILGSQFDTLKLYTSGSEQMRIDSSGQVDITTGIIGRNPTDNFTLNGKTQPFYGFNLVGTSSAPTAMAGYHGIAFATNSFERMRIDSSGRLLVGTSSSPNAGAGQYAKLLSVGNTLSSTGDGRLALARGNTAANLSSGNGIGELLYTDNTGATFAAIGANVDGTPGTNDYPGRLTFSTTADGDNSPDPRMTIKSSGFVGINELSPSAQLTVKRANTSTSGLSGVLKLKQGSATNGNRASLLFSSLDDFDVAAVNGVIETHSGTESNNVGRLEFYTKASGGSIDERMRIDSSGNVGIGATTVDAKLHVNGDNADILLGNKAGQYFRLKADTSGNLTFNDNDTVERMRIDSSGNVGIGTTNPSTKLAVVTASTTACVLQSTGNNVYLQLANSADGSGNFIGGNSNNLTFWTEATARMKIAANGESRIFSNSGTSTIQLHNGSSSGTTNRLLYGLHSSTDYTDGTPIYSIFTNGTVGTPSDIRLKKNVETTRDGYLADLASLRVVKYHWKTQEDSEPKELGLIAQEVEEVFPGLIHTEGEGDNEVKEIKRSVIPYMLLKALQEANAKIESLETRIAALES